MSGWRKQPIGDLPLYQARIIAGLPNITQGFTTRDGGVSAAPYDTLNLGSQVADAPDAVGTNRQRLWSNIGFTEAQTALAEQVHGNQIAIVTVGTGISPTAGVDALITDTPGVLLMLFYADCVPIYLADPVKKIIGLVHAGWRGAAANIAAKTVRTMAEEFGTRPETCLTAIGPCIGGESYEVGPEVADRFRSMPSARSGNAVMPRSEFSGTYNLNLRQVVFGQLLGAGIRAASIAVCDEDTYRNQRDFFSYRRDGVTGRMAAFLGMKETKTE